MTAGIQSTGPYSKLRELSSRLKVQRNHLANAPLGPRQKKDIEREIEGIQKELKVLRKEIRDAKPA